MTKLEMIDLQISTLEMILANCKADQKETEELKKRLDQEKMMINDQIIKANTILIKNLNNQIDANKKLRNLRLQRVMTIAEEEKAEEFGRVKEFWRDLRETAKANGFRWIVDLDDISSLMNISKEKAEEWDGLFRKYHQELGTDRQGGGWVVE